MNKKLTTRTRAALKMHPLFLVAENSDGRLVDWPGPGQVNQHLVPLPVWSMLEATPNPTSSTRGSNH